jgi:hypothetical protein
MALTNERIQAIGTALENEQLRKEVLEMEPAAAAERLNEEGNDFTADELVEFGCLASEATNAGELDAADLESVAGGNPVLAILGVGFAIRVSYDVGKALSKKIW